MGEYSALTSDSRYNYNMTYSYSVSGSTATVYVDCYVKRNKSSLSSYNRNGGSASVSINGSVVNSGTVPYDLRNDNWNLIISGSKSISMGSSSSISVPISFSFNGNLSMYNPNGTISTSFTINQTTFQISYNANGGSGAPSSQTKTSGETLTLSSKKPTRSGYTFLGWSTYADGSGSFYSPGGSYTANTPATLYAIWQRNTAALTYDANGGFDPPSVQQCPTGDTIILSSKSPIKHNCTFLGWSSSKTASSASYSAGGTMSGIYSATVLYAVWSSPRAKQNIYLTSTGKCYCYEFIEGNSVSFGTNGEMISNSFVETGTSTNKFLLTQTMSFNELVEGTLI